MRMTAKRFSQRVSGLILAVIAAFSCGASGETLAPLKNRWLTVSVRTQDGSFELRGAELSRPVLAARVGAEVDHQWIWSTEYPKHEAASSSFQTVLGSGRQIEVSFTGLAKKPDLKYILRLYDDLAVGDIQVEITNSGGAPVSVQDIRVLDVVGEPRVDLAGPNASARVLSDSYSEDRPTLRIFDLGKAPPYLGEDDFGKSYGDDHRAVGSQLIYNQKSKVSLFLAALTSDRWLTILHLKTARSPSGEVQISSYTVDSTGTTEIMKTESIRDDPPADKIELSLPVPAGGQMASEQVMFSVGQDYYVQLETYGRAVKVLHNALVSKPAPWGWWSWTAYYFGLSQSTALSNAQWLSQNLRDLGFNFFHMDEGYSYSDGEYATANAALFPDGLREFSHKIHQLGLNLALWVGPLRVSERAWVYQNHPEWLLHNYAGKPIQIEYVESSHDALYILDPTHPGAQEYLRRTFETLTRDWGARYFKLDFMDDTAIEANYYRPNTTALEAQRIYLKIIRDAVGPDVYLDKDGSPMLNTVGLTELGRLSTDTGHSFQGDKEDAPGIAARYYMNGNFYLADPDAFSVARQLITDQTWHQSKTPLTLDDAEVSITLAAVAGGMFELGDDLPTMGADPDRVSLVKNKDLLDMVRLGRSSKPLDLMTYSAEDEQPSLFFLREDQRQAMLAVFNWTEGPRSHEFKLNELGLASKGAFKASDVFRPSRPVELAQGSLRIDNQAPHSVRLIQIVDSSLPPSAPSVSVQVPGQAQIGAMVHVSAAVGPNGAPALFYHWNFGDGITAEGPFADHAYTRNGVYKVVLTVDGLDGIAATETSSITIQGTIRTTYDVENARRYKEH
jgi:alpha-galactosidase